MSERIGRAFLAVVPGERALDALARVVTSLALPDGWRATTREQWHVTLQFLGGVDDVDGVARAVSSVASRHRAFDVALGGGGAFPTARRAGAAWIGARSGERALHGSGPSAAHECLRRVAPAIQQDRTSICCLGLVRAFADD